MKTVKKLLTQFHCTSDPAVKITSLNHNFSALSSFTCTELDSCFWWY